MLLDESVRPAASQAFPGLAASMAPLTTTTLVVETAVRARATTTLVVEMVERVRVQACPVAA